HCRGTPTARFSSRSCGTATSASRCSSGGLPGGLAGGGRAGGGGTSDGLAFLAVAGQGTPATVLLAKLGVAHTVHSYPHDPRHGSFGIEAAEAMGVETGRVFKTLIAEVDGKLTAAM